MGPEEVAEEEEKVVVEGEGTGNGVPVILSAETMVATTILWRGRERDSEPGCVVGWYRHEVVVLFPCCSNPYSRRAHMDNQDEEGSGSKGSGDRPSVFSRIGGNGGGGGGGGRGRSSYRGGGGGRPSHGRSSWHKVTVS